MSYISTTLNKVQIDLEDQEDKKLILIKPRLNRMTFFPPKKCMRYSCPANRTNDSICFLSFMVSPRSSFWHSIVTTKLCRHHIEGTKSENFMDFQVFASEEILIIQLRKESRISFRKVTLNWLKIFLFPFWRWNVKTSKNT